VVRIGRALGGCVALAAASALLLGPFATATPTAAGATDASTAAALYREAMATTKAWTVHYASASNVSKVPFMESGDAGPASGTQAIHIGRGTTLDTASLVVIGDLTFVKGNKLAMENLTGLSSAQATEAKGHWILFSSNNPAFSQVVVGVRSHDVAQEVALEGPYTLGPSRVLNGQKVESVRGTQKLQGEKRMDAILYVRASGRHVLVEEDTVKADGKPNGAEHIVFSKWGQPVKPSAPDASITLGKINTT
jgi:hypothetical protein